MPAQPPFQVYIGWDSREVIAYDVAAHSLLRHARQPVDIHPLKQEELRAAGLYTRDKDPLASTEFTYTRFLVPHLAGYRGWAVFVDCDFLFTGDIADLFALATAEADERYAVMCVHHDYRPTETVKMDGVPQTSYPRKNWSSLMLINCAHPSTRTLTPDVVNRESGAFLHRMQWAADDEIGSVPETWNWLVGHKQKPAETPKAIHYTLGGPWFENWRKCDYGDLWLEEERMVLAKTKVAS